MARVRKTMTGENVVITIEQRQRQDRFVASVSIPLDEAESLFTGLSEVLGHQAPVEEPQSGVDVAAALESLEALDGWLIVHNMDLRKNWVEFLMRHIINARMALTPKS